MPRQPQTIPVTPEPPVERPSDPELLRLANQGQPPSAFYEFVREYAWHKKLVDAYFDGEWEAYWEWYFRMTD